MIIVKKYSYEVVSHQSNSCIVHIPVLYNWIEAGASKKEVEEAVIQEIVSTFNNQIEYYLENNDYRYLNSVSSFILIDWRAKNESQREVTMHLEIPDKMLTQLNASNLGYIL